MEHEFIACDSVQFLEGWIDVLGNGLLKKTTLKSSDNQPDNPQNGQNVKIWTRIMLENRKNVEPPKYLSFTIGSGDVCQALEICVPLMKVEETILILADVRFCPPSAGCQPPGSRLFLEVTLLSIRGARIIERSEEGQLELIHREREKGNNYFQMKDYQLALFTYTCALKIIESSSEGEIRSEQKVMLLDEKVKCYSNMAACHLKTGNLKETLSCCDVVLQHRPHHCKALFRKGKVLAMQQIYPLSIVFLKKALAVEPEHPEIKDEIKAIISTWKKQRIPGITEKFGHSSSKQTITRQSSFKNINWKWTLGISAVVLGSMILYKWR
ncbi:peptidyl-prolyl cis-trans isomerase FKBP8-like isoform X1 [Scyliorhinus canicula]|uniref:peptidyl-prolyl cis-trans isomerase FKBP8-like isoform X1 n=2 Tax=Scyliorhinus canicula TaxID=7830 RepID=UPI0018F6E8C7|nr:peptidyl-prolyl cis-trans isomerase FKBP8-like isoform X1 [Scyliorhinus canicula]